MSHPRSIQWVPSSRGYPPFATEAGIDNGQLVYVVRAQHNGGVVPGKLVMGHSSAYIAYGGDEIPKSSYEVLVAPPATVSWVDASGSSIPNHAVPGGRDPNGEVYYIGRVYHQGTITVGKVHPSHGSCYVPYGGKEHAYKQYEVLVRNAFGRAINA